MTQRRALNADRNIGFSATVSARALNVDGSSIKRFLPPERHKPPAHRHKLIAGRRRADDFDLRRRRDVVARLEIARLADQIGEPMELFPGKMLCEASAHGGSIALTSRLAHACVAWPARLGIGLSPANRRRTFPPQNSCPAGDDRAFLRGKASENTPSADELARRSTVVG